METSDGEEDSTLGNDGFATIGQQCRNRLITKNLDHRSIGDFVKLRKKHSANNLGKTALVSLIVKNNSSQNNQNALKSYAKKRPEEVFCLDNPCLFCIFRNWKNK